MPDTPVPAATVARALLASLVRHVLIMIGTALVTRGLVDQGTVDGYMATAVEMVVGALIVAGSTAWGVFWAFWTCGAGPTDLRINKAPLWLSEHKDAPCGSSTDQDWPDRRSASRQAC